MEDINFNQLRDKLINSENCISDEEMNELNFEDVEIEKEFDIEEEDYEFIDDLNDFNSLYNRIELINSPKYQKKKAFKLLKDLLNLEFYLIRFSDEEKKK